MPILSSSPSWLKSTFSLYISPLSSLRFACGSWVGFWSDLWWSNLCLGGLIGFMVVWYVLWWGFMVVIDFRFCFSFPGWWWWCSCGFEIWLWFWWLGLVVLGGGDNSNGCCGCGGGWMGLVSNELWVFFFLWWLVVEWVLWLVGCGGSWLWLWLWIFFFFLVVTSGG